MERSLRWGSAVFGTGMIAFGLMNLVRLDLVPGVEPLPAWMPGRPVWAVLSGAVLVAAGAGLVAHRLARLAATTLAVLLSVWVVCLHLPRWVLDPTNGGLWVPLCEALALAAAAWVLRSTFERTVAWDRAAMVARACFGLMFLAFGLSHFIYLGYVESVIPAWLPGHRFWGMATGIAHLAAGVSLLTRVRDRLAATMLALMFGLWVVVLHAPRVAAHPENANEWGSLIVALAMCGASWLVAGSLTRAPAAASARLASARLVSS